MREQKTKELPLGIQTFKKIIDKNLLYIDKTEHIYRLIKNGEIYFLSRPRRFGKSLTVSTLEEIFKGNRELFKGLYIYDTDYDFKKYPIIRFDFGELAVRNSEEMEQRIREYLLKNARYNDTELSREKDVLSLFSELIEKLSKNENISL